MGAESQQIIVFSVFKQAGRLCRPQQCFSALWWKEASWKFCLGDFPAPELIEDKWGNATFYVCLFLKNNQSIPLSYFKRCKRHLCFPL